VLNKLGSMGMENILGVENIFEKKYIKRMETAYADGD
jgi:hypothetical protein